MIHYIHIYYQYSYKYMKYHNIINERCKYIISRNITYKIILSKTELYNLVRIGFILGEPVWGKQSSLQLFI